MSREILFKAKRKNWRELPKEEWWVEGSYHNQIYYYGNPCDDHYIIDRTENGYGEYWEIDPETLCQYTGLTDKNGKRIWENDIVDTYESDSGETLRNVVKFKQGCFKVFKNHYLPMYLDKYNTSELEVYGNVCDNPELLGGAE